MGRGECLSVIDCAMEEGDMGECTRVLVRGAWRGSDGDVEVGPGGLCSPRHHSLSDPRVLRKVPTYDVASIIRLTLRGGRGRPERGARHRAGQLARRRRRRRPRTGLGRAVQVDPIKPMLKPPGTKRLKLNCDVLLSTSAFKINLRRYTLGLGGGLPTVATDTTPDIPHSTAELPVRVLVIGLRCGTVPAFVCRHLPGVRVDVVVGWCMFKHVLKRMVSARGT